MLTLKIDDKEIEDIFVNQFHSDMQVFVASIKAAFLSKGECQSLLEPYREKIEKALASPASGLSNREVFAKLREKYDIH